MVEFIELSDSDSSCENQEEYCFSSRKNESHEKPINVDSPIDAAHRSRVQQRSEPAQLLQDGKPVLFWESFSTSKRNYFNDDGSIQRTETHSPDELKSLSASPPTAPDSVGFQNDLLTIGKFNNDSSEKSSLAHSDKIGSLLSSSSFSDEEEDLGGYECSNRNVERANGK